MKRTLSMIIVIIAACYMSCSQSYTDATPLCNDTIPVRLATNLLKRAAVYIQMGGATSITMQQIEDYEKGNRFDEKTNNALKEAFEIADSIGFSVSEIRPTHIDEKIKRCDCAAVMTINGLKVPVNYYAQNTEEGTWVELKDR